MVVLQASKKLSFMPEHCSNHMMMMVMMVMMMVIMTMKMTMIT